MKEKKILIATTNPGKFHEIMEVLGGLPFEFVFLGDLDVAAAAIAGRAGDFVEDGETFYENAVKKAEYFSGKTGLMALAEDSGILVDSLSGELGVKTRRWGAGENASDEEWIEHFLERMSGEADRGAKFVCSACLAGEGVRERFDGECCGVITRELQAPILAGLPLSSCFLPDGCDKVYAALGAEEKNKISHRGKAIKQVLEYFLK